MCRQQIWFALRTTPVWFPLRKLINLNFLKFTADYDRDISIPIQGGSEGITWIRTKICDDIKLDFIDKILKKL